MKYEVTRYYSTFVTFEIEANSEEEAYNKTKEQPIDVIEIQNNLENWGHADEIRTIEKSERKKQN
ncbi:MAG: hypothetical protein ACUZ8O_03175 [Candidatus Anammoxibacter sp.]